MSGRPFQNPSLRLFKRERLFTLFAQEAGEIHHSDSGGAQSHTPIRLNDKIELVSAVKAEMLSDRFGDGRLALAGQRDNHNNSFLLLSCITLAQGIFCRQRCRGSIAISGTFLQNSDMACDSR